MPPCIGTSVGLSYLAPCSCCFLLTRLRPQIIRLLSHTHAPSPVSPTIQPWLLSAKTPDLDLHRSWLDYVVSLGPSHPIFPVSRSVPGDFDMHKTMRKHCTEILQAHAAAKRLPRKKPTVTKAPKREESSAPSEQMALKMPDFFSHSSSSALLVGSMTPVLSERTDGDGALRKGSKTQIQPSRGKENPGQGSGAKRG